MISSKDSDSSTSRPQQKQYMTTIENNNMPYTQASMAYAQTLMETPQYMEPLAQNNFPPHMAQHHLYGTQPHPYSSQPYSSQPYSYGVSQYGQSQGVNTQYQFYNSQPEMHLQEPVGIYAYHMDQPAEDLSLLSVDPLKQEIPKPHVYDHTHHSESPTFTGRPDPYNYLNPTLPSLNSYGAAMAPEPVPFLANNHSDLFSGISEMKPPALEFRSSSSSVSSVSSTDSDTKRRKKRSSSSTYDMTPETARRNRCKICNKQFKRPSSLQTHYNMHTGEKIYKCTWKDCGKLFSVKSNMTRHYRLHERDLKREQEMQMRKN